MANIGHHGALRPAARGVVVLVDAGSDGNPAPLIALLVLDAQADVGGGRWCVSLDTRGFSVEDGDVGYNIYWGGEVDIQDEGHAMVAVRVVWGAVRDDGLDCYRGSAEEADFLVIIFGGANEDGGIVVDGGPVEVEGDAAFPGAPVLADRSGHFAWFLGDRPTQYPQADQAR